MITWTFPLSWCYGFSECILIGVKVPEDENDEERNL